MHISGISANILEGGTKRITITADFTRSEEIEESDSVALMNYLRELGGEETAKPKTEEKPKARGRGRPKKSEEPKEDEDAPKSRSKKVEEPEPEEDEEEPAPRKRKAKKKSDDEISDQDLVKACANAREELEEVYEAESVDDIFTELFEEFSIDSVGDLDADDRQGFLDKLEETKTKYLEDDD